MLDKNDVTRDPLVEGTTLSGGAAAARAKPFQRIRGDRFRRLSGIMRVGGLLLAIAIVMAAFQADNSAFMTSDNLLGLLRAMTTLAIVALGETLVIVSGEIDLSIGASYGMASTLMAVAWIQWGLPVYLAIPIALVGAACVGVFNGVVTTFVRVPSFIVTLGSLSIVQGITLSLSNAQTFNAQYATPPVNPAQLKFFTGLSNQSLPFNIPAQVVWLAALAVVFGILLHRSLFGFRLLAIGGNTHAARIARLPVTWYKILAFVLAAVMAAVASILDFSFIGTTQPNAGDSLTFPVFAAVIIGGASLMGGRGTIIGTISGALLLAVLNNGLTLLGIGSFTQLMFVGSITIIAVALDRWVGKWT
jgi:ribose/xylose/arabinose/galactoside ABC-type transport system permease subunit